jgi:hypothetical protein
VAYRLSVEPMVAAYKTALMQVTDRATALLA